jgi:hypothetical protein
MNAPTLYIIAADLTKMQVIANIDEADVGRMRPNQHVTFRVDAFPTDTFTGEVTQVRLQPTTVQNVVTYSTVISVPNRELKLKPGMTANVSIEINRKNNVLRIPNAATRFRPTAEMFQVLNQAVPPELERGRGGRGRGEGQRAAGGPGAGGPGGGPGGAQPAAPAGGAPQAGAPGAPAAAQAAPSGQQRPQGTMSAGQERGPRGAPGGGEGGRPAQNGSPQAQADGGGERQPGQGPGGRGGGRGFDPNMTPEERRKRMEERLAQMTPEERERFEARMREGGGRGGSGGGNREGGGNPGDFGGNRDGARQGGGFSGGNAAQGGNRQGGRSSQPAGVPATAQGATTIDSLFGPLPVVESRGTAWQYENKQLKAIRLRLGVSDGTYTEVLNESDVPANAEVVTSMTTGLEQRNQNQNQQNNPLMGPQRGQPGRGGPGGGGGGGGGGGRGRG